MEILRELLYALHGIEGKIVRFDAGLDRFVVDEQAGVPDPVRRLALRVAECGWLYRRVRQYTDARKAERSFGTVGQSFCAALHLELTEYYRLLATLEAQMIQEVRFERKWRFFLNIQDLGEFSTAISFLFSPIIWFVREVTVQPILK